jgi:hypothetical protein
MALMMKASLLLAALVLCCRASFIPELQQDTVPEPQYHSLNHNQGLLSSSHQVCVELLFNSV